MSRIQFSERDEIPAELPGGMHPETRRLIQRIKRTRKNVLSCRLRGPNEAKNRVDALRRAKKRGRVRYKQLRRSREEIFVRIR